MNFKLLIWVALLCLLAGDCFARVDREQSQRFYEEALEFFREESFDESGIQLRNALQQDPNNLPARIMLGRLLLRQNQPLAAIKELEKAHAMGGDENLLLVPLASAYLEVARPEQVITGFVAEGHRPEVDGELQLLQAEASLQLGDKKRAQELFLSAGTLMPVDPRPLIGRARLELSKGKVKRAVKITNEAVALAPESFDAWMFKAIFHRDQHQYKDSIAAFEKALEVNPTSGRALTARAAMWMDIGDVEKAKKDLKQVSNLESDTLETVYLRTLIMFRDGKADEARQLLRENADEIRQIKDEFRDKLTNTKLMLGVVAFFEGNYDEAAVHLKGFLARYPNHLGAKRYMAAAYLALGDFKQVIRIYKPSMRSAPPRDPMALSLLAEAYRATGDSTTAEEYFAAALKLAPNVAGIGVKLAASRLDAGRAEEAIKELERLTARFPDMQEAWIQLVRVHAKSGNIDDAVKTVDAMLLRFKDNAQVHNIAGSTYLAAGDADKARLHITLAGDLDPELILPQLNLARLARLRGEAASAQALYRAALERFPTSATANLELAELLSSSGEFNEALERVNDVLRSDPKLFEAHELKLQLVMSKREDAERIRSAIYEIVSTFPEDARADLMAGKIYRRMRNLADARVHFRRAVEKAAFETDVLYQVANQQYGIADFSGALWTLTKAIQSSPNNRQVAVLRAATLTELGEFDKAGEAIEKLFADFGASPPVHTVKGDWLMKNDRASDAAAEYLKAHELSGSFKTAQTYFRAMVAANQTDEAGAFIRKWIDGHPRHLGSKHLYAQMLMREKKWAEARTVYEELQSAGIEDVVLLNNLATSYQHLGDPRALPTAEAAHNMSPNDPRVADTYGWILIEQGQLDEGLALLREAYARASTSPQIRYHIGLALARLGRNDEAAEEVQAALAADERFSSRDEAVSLLDRLKQALR